MNLVEKVYRHRDELFEKNKLPIILPEEELKKHQKDPKLNPNEMPGLTFNHPPTSTKDVIKFDVKIPSNIIPAFDRKAETAERAQHKEKPIVVQPDSVNQERYCVCVKKNDN